MRRRIHLLFLNGSALPPPSLTNLSTLNPLSEWLVTTPSISHKPLNLESLTRSALPRVDLELNGTWECEPVVQLVVIGTRLECEGTLASLKRCIADQDEEQGVMEAAQREAEKFEGMVRDDDFFEAAGREGCIVTFGLRESLEMRLQGIYATDLNSELVAFVNGSPSSVLAYPSKDEGTGKVPPQGILLH